MDKPISDRTGHFLELVGIENANKRMSSYPHELFSGGQRQRAMIAMALANNPELLVADEPTTVLDVTVKAQVIDHLKSLQRQFNMTVDHVKTVDGITIRVRQGHSLGIVGESGSGKTTLGLAILRLIRSNGGIVFQKSAIDGYNQKQMRSLQKELQVVFQDPFGSLSPRLSIAKIIEEGLEIHRPTDKAGFEAEIIKVLEEVDLDPDVGHRYPHEFSGVSGSGSRLPGPWYSNPNCLYWMNRPPL